MRVKNILHENDIRHLNKFVEQLLLPILKLNTITQLQQSRVHEC